MSPCATPDLDALEKPTAPLPINSIPRQLKVKPAELVPILRKQIEELILRAIKSKDLEKFCKNREKDISEYCAFVTAISKFVGANLDSSAQKTLIQGNLSSHEQWFKQNGPSILGIDAANQALFHFVTYRKAYDFVAKIKIAEKLSDQHQIDEDRSLAKRCFMASMWVWYHYEILIASTAKKLTPSPEVLTEILKGLKFVDITYTCAKQAYLIRYPAKASHKFLSKEHPCDHVARGSVEAIATDALGEFHEWSPSRDRANKSSIPQ